MKYEKPLLASFPASQDLCVAGTSPTAPGEIGLDDEDIEF